MQVLQDSDKSPRAEKIRIMTCNGDHLPTKQRLEISCHEQATPYA